MTATAEVTLCEIRTAAPAVVLGSGGYYSMTLGQFGALLQGAEPLKVFARGTLEDLTVFEYYTIQGLADFIRGYVDNLVKFTVKPQADEPTAAVPMSAAEGLLVFARNYFGLHSFAETEQLTLADILIAKKDTYNQVMAQRAYAAKLKKGVRKR